jgi:hypothetical protein
VTGVIVGWRGFVIRAQIANNIIIIFFFSTDYKSALAFIDRWRGFVNRDRSYRSLARICNLCPDSQ